MIIRRCAVPVCLALLLLAVTPGAALGSGDKKTDTTAQHDPVIASLEQRIAQEPESPCLHNELGVALARRSYFREAEGAFKDSLRLQPDAIVHNNLGSLYLTLSKPGTAASEFRKAISLDPNFALAYSNLGASYDARSDFDGAVSNFRRAFELDPSLADPTVNPQVVNNRYMTAVRTARYKETVGALGLPLRSTCPPPPSEPQAPAQPAQPK